MPAPPVLGFAADPKVIPLHAVLDSYLFIRKQEYFNKFKQLGAVG
jgi:hypothetical protein